MITLPKPNKTIKYKDLKIPLYPSTVLIKMLGKKYETFVGWEKAGFFPAPLFLNGTRRYYMSFELQAVADTLMTHGLPRFVLGEENDFSKDIKEKWKDIRAYVLNGKYPPQPIKLQFKNKEEFNLVIKEALLVFGLKGEVQAESVAETIINKASVL